MGNEPNPAKDSNTNNIVEIKSNQLNMSDSIDESENSNDSTVIKEDNSNQNIKNISNSYALLSTNNNYNSDNIIIDNKNNKKKKNEKNRFKKKDIQINSINYCNNIYKKESIIGICLNLFFWIWTILLLRVRPVITLSPLLLTGSNVSTRTSISLPRYF